MKQFDDDLKENENEGKVNNVLATGGGDAAAILKRSSFSLEDGDWAMASAYAENALNIDPENSIGYLYKVMADKQVNKLDDLFNIKDSLTDNPDYKKAIRFADDELRDKLIECSKQIEENIRLDNNTRAYENATEKMKKAQTEESYLDAAELFAEILDFKDSEYLYQQCKEKAEEARLEYIYNNAVTLAKSGKSGKYAEAAKQLETISGWKDTDDLIKEYSELSQSSKKKEKKRITIFAVFVVGLILCIATAFLAIKVIIPNNKYNSAVSLMNEGKYEEAITEFEAMNGYKDSKDKIDECRYGQAVALMEKGDYEEAIMAFEAMGGYKDCKDRIKECRYILAVALMDGEDFYKAMSALEAMKGYKDSSEKAKSIFEQYELASLKTAAVGDIVTFGTYEQDLASDGKENIEWIVLDKRDGKLLLISRFGLDYRNYNTGSDSVTWETCSMREWLNSTFMDTAFLTVEQSVITDTKLKNPDNKTWGTYGGRDTTDKLFLLSIDEAQKYFPSDDEKLCVPTDYCVSRGAPRSDTHPHQTGGKPTCEWWLRSPSISSNDASYVDFYGEIEEGVLLTFAPGVGFFTDINVVRPALWITP